MTENSLKALCRNAATETKGALKASLSFSGASKSGNHVKLAFSGILLQRASLILIFSTYRSITETAILKGYIFGE